MQPIRQPPTKIVGSLLRTRGEAACPSNDCNNDWSSDWSSDEGYHNHDENQKFGKQNVAIPRDDRSNNDGDNNHNGAENHRRSKHNAEKKSSRSSNSKRRGMKTTAGTRVLSSTEVNNDAGAAVSASNIKSAISEMSNDSGPLSAQSLKSQFAVLSKALEEKFEDMMELLRLQNEEQERVRKADNEKRDRERKADNEKQEEIRKEEAKIRKEEFLANQQMMMTMLQQMSGKPVPSLAADLAVSSIVGNDRSTTRSLRRSLGDGGDVRRRRPRRARSDCSPIRSMIGKDSDNLNNDGGKLGDGGGNVRRPRRARSDCSPIRSIIGKDSDNFNDDDQKLGDGGDDVRRPHSITTRVSDCCPIRRTGGRDSYNFNNNDGDDGGDDSRLNEDGGKCGNSGDNHQRQQQERKPNGDMIDKNSPPRTLSPRTTKAGKERMSWDDLKQRQQRRSLNDNMLETNFHPPKFSTSCTKEDEESITDSEESYGCTINDDITSSQIMTENLPTLTKKSDSEESYGTTINDDITSSKMLSLTQHFHQL